MKIRKSSIAIALLFAVAIAVLIVFSLPDFTLIAGDDKANKLLIDILPRAVTGIVLIILLAVVGYRNILFPSIRRLPKSLLWCLPCFLVVLANCPITAFAAGAATVDRVDLIWLFALKCLAVGLMEELFFRGLVLPTLLQGFKKYQYRHFLAVLISSAIFGLWHIVNLFYGAGPVATLLQVGYSFLIGAMLAVTLIYTGNIWLCVIIHALFNFGGTIVRELGSGAFQDTYFWIFTAAAGVICAANVIYTLIKAEKNCYANI